MRAFRFSGFVIALYVTALSCGDGGGLFGSSTGSVFIGESLALGQTLHGVTLDSNLTISMNNRVVQTIDRGYGPHFASVTAPSPRHGHSVVSIGFIEGSGSFDNVYTALIVTPSGGDILYQLQDEHGRAYGITGSVAWSSSERYAVLPVNEGMSRQGLLIVDFETENIGRLLSADLGCYSPVPSLENARWLSETVLELWVMPNQSHRRWDDPGLMTCQQPPPYRLFLDVANEQFTNELLRPVVFPGTELPIDTVRSEVVDGLLFVLNYNREEQKASAVPIAHLSDSGFGAANALVGRQEYRDAIAEQDLLAVAEGRPFGSVSLTTPAPHEYDIQDGCSWEPAWRAFMYHGARGLVGLHDKVLLLPTAWSNQLQPSWRPANEEERHTLESLTGTTRLSGTYALLGNVSGQPTLIGSHSTRGMYGEVEVLSIAEEQNGAYALVFTAGSTIEGEEVGNESAEFIDAIDLDNDDMPEIIIHETGWESWGWSVLKRTPTGWTRSIERAAAGGC